MQIRPTSLGLLLVGAAVASAQNKPAGKADEMMKWGPAPAVFPKGASMMVMSGDPGKAAMFTIHLYVNPADESAENGETLT